jgi:hypothetical protein
MFSASYVLAIPSVCPHLKIDANAARERVQAGKRAWAESFGRDPTDIMVERVLISQEAEAGRAIEADAKEIPSFCKRVLDAFGERGHVMPRLILGLGPK